MKNKYEVIRTTTFIVGIFFGLFLMIFSFDVFGEPVSFRKKLLGFLIHNIPSFLIFLFAIAARKRPIIGSAFFTTLGILYLLWAWGRFDISVYFIIAGPLFILGITYWWLWRFKSTLIKVS